MKTLGPCDINLSRLNPTPHAIAVYASQPLSPVTTQHSLPSGRYSLLGPDSHRLDRTSLRLAHSFDDLVGPEQVEVGISKPSVLAVLRLIFNSILVGCSIGISAGLAPFKILPTICPARRNVSKVLAP